MTYAPTPASRPSQPEQLTYGDQKEVVYHTSLSAQ
jgi:hypothetical protein